MELLLFLLRDQGGPLEHVLCLRSSDYGILHLPLGFRPGTLRSSLHRSDRELRRCKKCFCGFGVDRPRLRLRGLDRDLSGRVVGERVRIAAARAEEAGGQNGVGEAGDVGGGGALRAMRQGRRWDWDSIEYGEAKEAEGAGVGLEDAGRAEAADAAAVANVVEGPGVRGIASIALAAFIGVRPRCGRRRRHGRGRMEEVDGR